MLTIVEPLLEILKYTIPAVVVLIATYLIVNKFLTNDTERKQMALFGEQTTEKFKMRLGAYERLAMYCERIHPNALIQRTYMKGASAQDMQLAMIRAIREEFEHNLSQQLYVSNEVWQAVKSAKEQEISMVNQIGSSMEMGAPAKDFIQKVSEFALDDATQVPADIALEIIKGEAKMVLVS